MSFIQRKVRKFVYDESGTLVIEAIIIFPILTWALVAMTVYFDAFRVRSVNLKAAYTISDMLSRENPIVDENYVQGLKTVFDFLVASNHPTWVRISLVRFDINDVDDAGDDEHFVKWSWASDGETPWTNDTISQIESRIPIMANGDTTLIVETHMRYVPAFKIGIKPYDLENFITTRPRFASPCWETCIN